MILVVSDIVTLYSQILVLDRVSLEVGSRETVVLLGRNGVGKTTTLRSIMGLTPPRSGSIKFNDIEIIGKPPFKIAELGVSYVPDDRRIFSNLTTEDNLMFARHLRRKKRKNGEGWTIQKVYQLFPSLERVRNNKGGNLSGGEQKMLAVGRALMKNPELLLLDEPSEGLAPLVVNTLAETIKEIQKTGIAILVADQNLRFCRRIAGRGYIIVKGIIRYQDKIENIWQSDDIIKKYLAV